MKEIRVSSRAELTEAGRLFLMVDGREIGVLDHEGELVAYENRCRHQGGPVCEGIVIGKVEAILDDSMQALGERFSGETLHLVCPWHGWEYDLRTGLCATDKTIGLRKYEIIEHDGTVFVLMPDE